MQLGIIRNIGQLMPYFRINAVVAEELMSKDYMFPLP